MQRPLTVYQIVSAISKIAKRFDEIINCVIFPCADCGEGFLPSLFDRSLTLVPGQVRDRLDRKLVPLSIRR